MRADVVEKVARSLDPMAWVEPRHPELEFRRRRSVEQAVPAITALLEALEEPSEGMVEAAFQTMLRPTPEQRMALELCDNHKAFDVKMRQRWKAMLSAFREEG